MVERKFVKGITKTKTAAAIRHSVSAVVQETRCSISHETVPPVDYETFLEKDIFKTDPQKQLLYFPIDDIKIETFKKRIRTEEASVTSSILENTQDPFGKECLAFYSSSYEAIKFKHSEFGGSYFSLPSIKDQSKPFFAMSDFESDFDEADDSNNDLLNSPNVTKFGYLWKTPFGSASDRSSGLFKTRSDFKSDKAKPSFKRRMFRLNQRDDSSYTLDYFKEDRRNSEHKGTLSLNHCHQIRKTNKYRKFGFELVTDRCSYQLAAESDAELDCWVDALSRILRSDGSEASSTSRQNEFDDEDDSDGLYDDTSDIFAPCSITSSCASLSSTGQNSTTQLSAEIRRYISENDRASALARKENRHSLFQIYFEATDKSCVKHYGDCLRSSFSIETFKEPETTKFLVSCEELSFKIRNMMETKSGDVPSNIEPFFVTLCIYDAARGVKLSQDISVDFNPPHLWKILVGAEVGWSMSEDDIPGPKQVIFSITSPSPDILLVAKIEKVLQGSVSSCLEQYGRGTSDSDKQMQKVTRQSQLFCQRFGGKFRMPFCWAARPIFDRKNGYPLLLETSFTPFIRHDPTKLTEEHLIRQLQDVRSYLERPEKFASRFSTIPGIISVSIRDCSNPDLGIRTPSLLPVKPFNKTTSAQQIAFEAEEFPNFDPALEQPCLTYSHHLYVSPMSLKYDGQKAFAKARNIACQIEIYDKDDCVSQPLKAIYGPAGGPVLCRRVTTAVNHHNSNPDFLFEVKIALPPEATTGKHHVLFTFYHVSCDAVARTGTNSKKNAPLEAVVGYSWILLFKESKFQGELFNLAVSTNLVPGYTSVKNFGFGYGTSLPDLKFVEGGKMLFIVRTSLLSTVHPISSFLHNFFHYSNKLDGSAHRYSELANHIQGMEAVPTSILIRYAPALLNKVLSLLTFLPNDVQIKLMRFLIHVVNALYQEQREDILKTYIKYVFVAPHKVGPDQKPVHEEIVENIKALLTSSSIDGPFFKNLLEFNWFFFDIIIKSMIYSLARADKLKQTSRKDMFSSVYLSSLQNLVNELGLTIVTHCKTLPTQIAQTNINLALFLKSLLSVMDRGFVFKLINSYFDKFAPFTSDDGKEYFLLRYELLRVVCQHEHFVQLNIPMLRKLGFISRDKGLRFFQQYQKEREMQVQNELLLCEEFCKKHCLVGLLLIELNFGLFEVVNIRREIIDVFKDVIAKLSNDERWNSETCKARVFALFLPYINILIDNVKRLALKSTLQATRRDSIDSLTEAVAEEEKNGASPSMRKARSLANLAPVNSTTSQRGSMYVQRRTMSTFRMDQLEAAEVKDLLLCFLCIIKSLSPEILKIWWDYASEEDKVSFLDLISLSLQHFPYTNVRRLPFTMSEKTLSADESKNLIARQASADGGRPSSSRKMSCMEIGAMRYPNHASAHYLEEASNRIMEARLATEAGMIALDTLEIIASNLKGRVECIDPQSNVMRQLFEVCMSFLTMNHSEDVLKHAFITLRSLLSKFPSMLFKGDTTLCARLCFEILRGFSSRNESSRRENCFLLYVFLRRNFIFTYSRDITRVHLQTIVAVSQLVGKAEELNSYKFQECLALVVNIANSDLAMQHTAFPREVKELMKRIRKVLTATAQLKEHESYPEMLVELQHSLANSYAGTPELRQTWLDSMACIHAKYSHSSEVAMCHLHIAALMAEYLRQRNVLNKGYEMFLCISPNVEEEKIRISDEANAKLVDSFTLEMFVQQLEKCAKLFEKAELFELVPKIYSVLIPIFDENRDYAKLASAHRHCCYCYDEIIRIQKRFLGTYYRVKFVGKLFGNENNKQYIYRENRVTPLAVMKERLEDLFGNKFGHENIRILQDNLVDVNTLDPQLAHIQVAQVEPYFDEKECKQRLSPFEKMHNLKVFFFDIPYTDAGGRHGVVADQKKRRIFLYTAHYLPNVEKRVAVDYQRCMEFSPVEFATENIEEQTKKLRDVITDRNLDTKMLQLYLGGSVRIQVNSGPGAFAKAFLEESHAYRFPANQIKQLREAFEDFLDVCWQALELNRMIVKSDQLEYHEDLKAQFAEMVQQLSDNYNIKFKRCLTSNDDNSSNEAQNTPLLLSAISRTSFSK